MEFDVILRGGSVVDGSGGRERFQGDVAIREGAIAVVGDLSNADADRTIDVSGKVVAPGFIDMHTHSDFTSLTLPTADSKVLSGVTTEVMGSCGASPFPLRGETRTRRIAAHESAGLQIDWDDVHGYIARAEAAGCSTNRVLMVGHNMVRGSVMGYEDREPSGDEIRRMVEEVEIALDAGAFGLTTGLMYPPGCFSRTREIIELCRPVAAVDGLYASHIRNEGVRLEESIEEVIEIHLESGVAVHVSHLKTSERANWHKIEWVRERLFNARDEGVDITADRYPYLASATGLDAVMPSWLFDGTSEDEQRRLKDPETRKRLRLGAAERFPTREDWETIVIALADKDENRSWEGRRLTDLAREMKLDPFDASCEMLLRDNLRTAAVYFHMNQENLEEVLSWPFVMIGSDASAWSAEPGHAKGKPHPRAFGTSARVLQEFCREKGILSLEQAVWKLAGLPAERLGLRDRGRIEEGFVADLTVFDPMTVSDHATYDDPFHYPSGIEYVFVNGVPTVEQGKHLGKLAGRILRRS